MVVLISDKADLKSVMKGKQEPISHKTVNSRNMQSLGMPSGSVN